MKACSQVCGVVFNPLDEDYVNVCEDCEDAIKDDPASEESKGTSSYYLGSCGLIIDYLL
ncbi:hypothetical protein GCM10008018_33150 [Paenibacillus marchantiophytorum]|uniref:Inhibitor of sigma-G Gin n=1 Tax=Paenibacillus marchantiophytorum TaxID=1619310 RepID=A0ABQ1ESC7_9BACL|nr:hypothetical protein [Paenibacillus marchantiophytorum]GFZ84353.1 hypothetical protein GCM10008018_33150 [Paenibacillus marchantiophytorum]